MAGPLPLPGALNHWGRYLPPRSYHLHTVCFWRGHSLCRAPLTTGVDIYPRVLPSAYCVLLAGHSLCRAPLTTGVDIYPRVLPSACCVLLAGPLPLQGALNHWGRYLPKGPTICILCASGTHTHTHTLDLTHHNVCFRDPIAGRP